MARLLKVAGVLLLSLALVVADCTETYSSQHCVTKSGTSSVDDVPTTTRTRTVSSTSVTTVTTTPTITIAPPNITAYETTTVTRTKPRTNLVDPSTFIDSTTTFVLSSLSTIWTTSTVINGYLTVSYIPPNTSVPAPPGFTPLGVQLAAAGDTWSKKKRQETEDELSEVERDLDEDSLVARERGRRRYPRKVICHVIVEYVAYLTETSTADATTVSAAQGTVTKTHTEHDTVFSYPVDPNPTSTYTYYPTVYSTTTVTTLATYYDEIYTTTTSYLPLPTAYEQCAPDNIVGYVNGDRAGYVTYFNDSLGRTLLYYTPSGTPLGCCIACAELDGCSGWDYDTNYPTYCTVWLSESTTCDVNFVPNHFTTGTGDCGAPAVIYRGNGQCGHVVYDGFLAC